MKRFASNVECSKGSSGGNTAVPFKRGVACTLNALAIESINDIHEDLFALFIFYEY